MDELLDLRLVAFFLGVLLAGEGLMDFCFFGFSI